MNRPGIQTILSVQLLAVASLIGDGCMRHGAPVVTAPPNMYDMPDSLAAENQKRVYDIVGLRRTTGGVLLDIVIRGPEIQSVISEFVQRMGLAHYEDRVPVFELRDDRGRVIHTQPESGPASFSGTVNSRRVEPILPVGDAFLVVVARRTQQPLSPGVYSFAFTQAAFTDPLVADLAIPVTTERRTFEIQ